MNGLERHDSKVPQEALKVITQMNGGVCVVKIVSYSSNVIFQIRGRAFVNVLSFAKHLSNQETKLPGDILLITAFVSYMGCFTKSYRQDLMYKMWLPFYMKLEVTVD